MTEGLIYRDVCDCALHACTCKGEKMKEQEDKWRGEFNNYDDTNAWISAPELWIAAKQSSQAEIDALTAKVQELQTRLSGQTCFVPPEFQAQLDSATEKVRELHNVIASKDGEITDWVLQLADTKAKHSSELSELRGQVDRLRDKLTKITGAHQPAETPGEKSD